MVEICDDFTKLMREVHERRPNPVITGYKTAIKELQDLLDEARRNTLYVAIDGLPSIVEMVLLNGVPYLITTDNSLVIDKVFCGGRTYTITEPLQLSVSIVVNGRGTSWNVFPRYGFHLLESSVCLGEYVPPVVKEWDECITVGHNIKKLLSGINCDSLGTVVLPQQYEEWKDIKKHPYHFVEVLTRRGTIKEVDTWI